jgi:hypothetical protein
VKLVIDGRVAKLNSDIQLHWSMQRTVAAIHAHAQLDLGAASLVIRPWMNVVPWVATASCRFEIEKMAQRETISAEAACSQRENVLAIVLSTLLAH